MEEEDAREVELTTIAAIYPELQIDENDSHRVSIDLPVTLTKPLTVLFPAATDAAPPVAPSQEPILPVTNVESQTLLNLPALHVIVALPDGYPQDKPPNVTISTSPPWLSGEILRKLEGDAERLWKEIGRDQVIFTYIDDLQHSTENVFGLVDDKGTLEVAPEHKIAILDYDINAKRKFFEKETFDCGICLDPKKGAVCHRMLDCGHVFCVQCLQDFYNNAITEGDVSAVQCLEPNCAKEREGAIGRSATKRRKPKTFLSPSELLQIPLDQDKVKRYVTLKHKTELESDKNTVYCPRPWCQGAARSKKHKKPEGLEFAEGSDDESDDEDATGGADYQAEKELLAICEDCGFAFCTRCAQSWHGEFKYCIPKERKEAITEEEKASLEYLSKNTTPCPTCAAPCQKTHGCNHMRCFRCQTHFCYLCSAWLDPSNPYRHFNIAPSGEVNGCYMRLWEAEEGDGGGAGFDHEQDDFDRNANVAAGQNGQHPEVVLQIAGNDAAGHDARVAGPGVAPEPRQQPLPEARHLPPPRQQPDGRAAVARREGPLVLRIEGDAPPAQGRGAVGRQPGPGIPNAHVQAREQAVNEGQRGGRGNRRGRGQGVNRQNNRNRPQGQNQQPNNVGRPGPNRIGAGDPLREENELNPQHEAWIRQFVQLALNDQEDLVDWDSDE
ncbi:Uu.00g092740.m01.CDS01 [Anthostomella pinea]|uniref:RBR-type E3 ubiquitin transferase n=1 Tax=Anthostomella pinea TaxID=933095 RepID=A0AAI8YKM2_9PEZI|nr:Uu.00g092740.m01.CDS01 [Anthostomella pinea]